MLRGQRGCCSPGPASTAWFQSWGAPALLPGLGAPLAALLGNGAGSLQGNLNRLQGSVAVVVPTERLLGQLGTQFWGPLPPIPRLLVPGGSKLLAPVCRVTGQSCCCC